MKTPEQIARVEAVKEGLDNFLISYGHYARECGMLRMEPDEGLWRDKLLRTVFKDVPVGGELLQTGRAPEDTAYKAQHDADSVTIGQVLEGK